MYIRGSEFSHFQVALGDPSKSTLKWFTLTSGSRQEFANHLKKQFPAEEVAIEKFMTLLNVS
jgi:hypothetical protein